jgi:hypothetical protein
MTRPERLVDAPDTPPALRDALARAPRAAALDGETRARVQRRLAKASLASTGVAVWLGWRTVLAAACVFGGGVAVAIGAAPQAPPVASVAVSPQPPPVALRAAPSERVPALPEIAGPSASSTPSAAALASAVPLAPSVEVPAPNGTTAAASTDSLGAESRLLEVARAALVADPRTALARVAEHRARFARPMLAAERTLIEIEALKRLGRRAEARALVKRALAASGKGIYTERLTALLAELERS